MRENNVNFVSNKPGAIQGEITMANEVLEEKIERLEGGRPLGGRRLRR